VAIKDFSHFEDSWQLTLILKTVAIKVSLILKTVAIKAFLILKTVAINPPSEVLAINPHSEDRGN
jgi:hypothetical protein